MYMGRRIARVRIDVISPEWVVASMLKDIQMVCKVISANRTKVVNWWGTDSKSTSR